MAVEEAPRRTTQSRALPLGLLVVGASLLVVAVAFRAAGSLGISDSSTSPSELLEIGRLSASRSIVAFLAAGGLCWIGFRGFTGAESPWIVRRMLGLSLGLLGLSAIQGLWFFAGVCGLLAAVCGLWLRTSRD